MPCSSSFGLLATRRGVTLRAKESSCLTSKVSIWLQKCAHVIWLNQRTFFNATYRNDGTLETPTILTLDNQIHKLNSSCLEHRKEEKSRVEMHGKANLYIERYLYKLVKQGALYCSKEVVGARAFVFPGCKSSVGRSNHCCSRPAGLLHQLLEEARIFPWGQPAKEGEKEQGEPARQLCWRKREREWFWSRGQSHRIEEEL